MYLPGHLGLGVSQPYRHQIQQPGGEVAQKAATVNDDGQRVAGPRLEEGSAHHYPEQEHGQDGEKQERAPAPERAPGDGGGQGAAAL